MTQSTKTAPAALQSDVVDALLRFTNGMDTDDGALIGSAFTPDALVDFTPAAAKVGMQFPVLKGQETIVGALVPFAKGYTTSHSVSNARATIDSATLYALVEAQHFLEGSRDRNFLMKNVYWVELRRDAEATATHGATWRISNMRIDNLWARGDIKVMTGN